MTEPLLRSVPDARQARELEPLEAEPRPIDPLERVRLLALRTLQADRADFLFMPAGWRPEDGPPTLPGRGARLLATLCDEVIRSGRTLAVADVRGLSWADTGARGKAPQLLAFLGTPLGAEDGGPGCLYVAGRSARHWTPTELETLEHLAFLATGHLSATDDAEDRRTLQNLVRMLGKAVENMQLGVTLTDTEGRIIYTNPAEAAMHGFELGELIGQHARILGPPELCRMMDSERIEAGSSWTRETVNVRKDGSRFPVLLWSDLVTDGDGNAIGMVTCSEDITERKRAEQELRDVALRDPLTGLPNRIYFLDKLNQAIEHSRRRTDLFAVLFLDLDRFKVVNDSLGHHVGDELLRVVSKRLQECLRPNDTVARFGGDEFAVLLENITGIEDAIGVVERIQSALTAPMHLDAYELFTSASIGIVLGSPSSDQPEYLWRSADMAMYRAKAAGTGTFSVFDRTMHADAVARLQLETDLRHAIEKKQFRVVYQPVVNLASGRIVGFEALLRWDHPLRGTISPVEVIPAAEETGMILAIGEWVLGESCRQLEEWQARFPRDVPLWIGVNLSSKQLSQVQLVEQVEGLLRKHRIKPQTLKLEITESAVVENTEPAAETLRRLKALGIQLLMDDFGTGYSSLSYLHRLPLDALKIDRSFVSQMERGDKHAQLIRTIVSLARSVRLKVVAEGVSTPDQLAFLRELGCEFGQGYLFSHALAPAEAGAMLTVNPVF